MGCAMGSVFGLNSLIIPSSGWKWLWLLQALTPFATFNMLGGIDATVRPSSGESISVMTMLSSVVSVPALALVYATLIALGAPGAVFYAALVAKLFLWALGHYLILKAQLDVKSRGRHSRIQAIA